MFIDFNNQYPSGPGEDSQIYHVKFYGHERNKTVSEVREEIERGLRNADEKVYIAKSMYEAIGSKQINIDWETVIDVMTNKVTAHLKRPFPQYYVRIIDPSDGWIVKIFYIAHELRNPKKWRILHHA